MFHLIWREHESLYAGTELRVKGTTWDSGFGFPMLWVKWPAKIPIIPRASSYSEDWYLRSWLLSENDKIKESLLEGKDGYRVHLVIISWIWLRVRQIKTFNFCMQKQKWLQGRSVKCMYCYKRWRWLKPLKDSMADFYSILNWIHLKNLWNEHMDEKKKS
jgi:hypothetical protein